MTSERKQMRWDEAAMRQFQARAGRWTTGGNAYEQGAKADGRPTGTLGAPAAASSPPMLSDGYAAPTRIRPQDDMRRAAKIDGTQQKIVEALRSVGARVAITAGVAGGFPDLVVGYRDRVWLIECKDGSLPPSARRLTPEQVRFHREWAGYCWLANSVDDALLIIGAINPKDAA